MEPNLAPDGPSEIRNLKELANANKDRISKEMYWDLIHLYVVSGDRNIPLRDFANIIHNMPIQEVGERAWAYHEKHRT